MTAEEPEAAPEGLTAADVEAYAALEERVRAGLSVPLTLAAPRRGRPPAHWADLTIAERRAAVISAGHPRFRADQLSRHYFEHFRTDADSFSDVPKLQRAGLVESFFPTLLSDVRSQSCDRGLIVNAIVCGYWFLR